jgi:hypothetical protein
MSRATHHPEDKKAAFTGLIVGAIALAALCYGVVLWTNARFAGHSTAAEATH